MKLSAIHNYKWLYMASSLQQDVASDEKPSLAEEKMENGVFVKLGRFVELYQFLRFNTFSTK